VITKRTTFVVGAGASAPYGLPTANKLGQEAKSMNVEHDVYQLLLEVLAYSGRGDHIDALAAFMKDFREHPGASIDAFLHHRRHQPETMLLGKALLAALLGRQISSLRKKVDYSDWIEHLLDFMSQDAPHAADFAAGCANVRFLTFNFDTVIEDAAARIIPKIYRGDSGIQEAVKAVKVTHIHGVLPPLPREHLSNRRAANSYRGNGINGEWIKWTSAASQQIQIVLEEIDAELLDSVESAVAKSEILCFLGFSYDRANLVKLGIPRRLNNDSQTKFGSAFGLSDAKREEVTERFDSFIKLGAENWGCVDLLNRIHILRG
jgi:hypothetical protein